MSDSGSKTPPKPEEVASTPAAEEETKAAPQDDSGPMSPPAGAPPPAADSSATAEGGATTEGAPAEEKAAAASEPKEEDKSKEEAKSEEAPKQEAPPAADTKATPPPPQGTSTSESSRRKGVRFSEDVAVAQLQFDEAEEKEQQRRAEQATLDEILEDPKSQPFFFRAMGRNKPKEPSPTRRSKKKKKKSEDEEEGADGDEGEKKADESGEGEKTNDEGVAPGDEAAAAAMAGEGGDGAAAEGAGGDATAATAGGDAAPSPSRANRSLKEKLRDFEYEVDPNERLYWQGLVKIDHKHSELKAKEEQLQKEAEEQRAAYKHTPSKAVQNLPQPQSWEEFLDARDQRTKAKKKVWDKKLQKTLTDRMEDVTFKPDIPKKSELLVQRMKKEKRYKDPVRGWRQHFDEFVTKDVRRSEQFEDHNVTPKRIRTTQEHFERLYQESAIRKAAQDIVSQAQEAEISAGSFRPEVHRSYSDFDDDVTSYSSRTPSELVNSLLHKGEESKKKVEDLRRKAEEETYTFTPKTNKLSQKMVQSWSERAVTPRGETGAGQPRHTARSIHDLSPDIKGVADGQRDKPKATFDVDLFYSKVHRAAAERQEKLDEIAQKKLDEELAECTFRPRTSQYDATAQNQSGSFSASNYSTPRKTGSARVAPQQQASARSTQSKSTPRTQRTAVGGARQAPAVPHLSQEREVSTHRSAPRSGRQQPTAVPTSARSAASRGSQRSQAHGKDYVVDLVAVPPSSSPTTARTLLDEDGSTDLAQLQQELMGVIAEWQNIDA